MQKSLFKHFLLINIICVLCLAAFSVTEAAIAEDAFNEIENGNITIYYSQDINIRSLSRRLNIDFIRQSYFSKPSLINLSDDEALAAKTEYIFTKVESILSMYPPDMKINIKIFKTKEQLADAYFDIFKRTDSAVSFYVHKYNTMYTYERGLTENVLAHELAHCVIDNYFKIVPPSNTAEIIAQHVDQHLKD